MGAAAAIFIATVFAGKVHHDKRVSDMHSEARTAPAATNTQNTAELKKKYAEGGNALPAHYSMGREPDQQGTTLLSGARSPTQLASKKPKAQTQPLQIS